MDPNDIVGQPREYEVWLAPDWSDYNEKQKKASNWTRVGVRETLYADGRRITQVLDANRAPITNQVLAQDTDTAQEKRFKDAQTTASRAQAQAERKETRTYTGTDPQTGRPATVTEYESGPPKYDEIKPSVSGAKEWRTEGTPDGQGGFNNSRPTMAAYVNGQRTGETRPPTAKELEDWNLAGQMTRNPGGKTDAQIATEKKEADAAAERAAANNRGTTTIKDDGKGGSLAVTTYPDGRTPTVVPLPNVPSTAQSKYKEVKQDPSTGKWSGLTASGQWEEITGGPGLAPDKSGFAIEPAGAPPASSRYGSIVEESLVKYRDFLNQQVAAGNLKPVDADKLMQTRLAQAQATMNEQQGVVNTQTGIYGQNISQRGQSLGDAQSRRTAAGNIHSTVMQSFMPLLKYMPLGGGQAFLDLLTHGMEEGLKNAQKWGGLRESPEIQLGPAAAAANRATLPGQGAPVAGGGSFLTPYQQGAPLPAAAAAAVAPPPEIPMTPERVQGIMQNPVFRPQPMVAAPAMAAPPMPGQGQDLSTPPAVNPPAGVPGHNPSVPVGMAQPSFLNPYQQFQPQPGSGLERMISDPDMPNEVVAQAYQEIYGRPMAGFGL